LYSDTQNTLNGQAPGDANIKNAAARLSTQTVAGYLASKVRRALRPDLVIARPSRR
jgi:hypothetical protein